MADVFFRDDAIELLSNKHIVFLGDSNSRAVYKDFLWLLNNNSLIQQKALKVKQEPSFCGDKLVKSSILHRGRDYEEERSYEKNGIHVDFCFLTKCYNATLVDMMEDIHLGLKEAPDVICINSTLWDVCRWGPNGVNQFKDNLPKLARMLKSSLPSSTLVIWTTSLPVSYKIQSSLLIKQIDFLRHTLRFDVMEANHFARQIMAAHGFDVLDNHFHMRMQIHRRIHDGIHYEPIAVRFLTNLLLTHIALSWDFPLPNRVETILLDKAKAQCAVKSSTPTPEIKKRTLLSENPKRKTPARKPGRERHFEPEERRVGSHRRTPYYEQRRPTRMENINDNWGGGGMSNERGWSRTEYASGRNNRVPPQTIWSEDHWPDEQPYQNEPRYQNEGRFSGSPWTFSSYPQTNNSQAMRGRRLASRYAPY